MDSKYSLNEKVSKYLDVEKNNVRYIKKKTFEQAVNDGELINKTAGKTSLKQASDKDNDKRYLVVSDDEQYVISKCPFSRLIGYIPVENDSFIDIEEREHIPNYKTYNLSIEGYHNYIVEGIVAHNAGCVC